MVKWDRLPSKLYVPGPLWGESTSDGGFPSQCDSKEDRATVMVDSPHKWPGMWKAFSYNYVIIYNEEIEMYKLLTTDCQASAFNIIKGYIPNFVDAFMGTNFECRTILDHNAKFFIYIYWLKMHCHHVQWYYWWLVSTGSGDDFTLDHWWLG